MAKNKQTIDPKNDADKALEAKVDAMMDLSAQETAAVKVAVEPLDIFNGAEPPIDGESQSTPGAPLLPGKPLKKAVDQPPQTVAPAAPTEKSPSTEPAVPENIEVKPLSIDTPQTDAAIDDIVAQEADEVLAAQDAGIEAAQAVAEPYEVPPKKRGHPVFWFIILLLVIVALIAAYVLSKPGLDLPFGS